MMDWAENRYGMALCSMENHNIPQIRKAVQFLQKNLHTPVLL